MNFNANLKEHCIIGICKGIAQRQITNRQTGEISVITELGLYNIVQDDFGHSQEREIRIAVPKGLVDKGHLGKLTALNGKRVVMPVWYRVYATKSGASQTPYLANDWEASHMVIPEPLAKAV